ncbi:hypothetical protein JA1_004298 [Spathaspora sp. JA1]|nr:hypothetical protein JA1_004298 [Spathaspora sp. JA1]
MHKLSILHTDKFISLSDGNIIQFCPNLNLLFISVNRTSLWIYRINGDRIYSINNKTPIQAIYFNQEYFLVLGVDSSIKIYNCNDGKLIHTRDTGTLVKYIHWRNISQDVTSKFNVDVLNQMPKLLLPNCSANLDYLVIVNHNKLTISFNNLTNVPKLNVDIEFNYVSVLPAQGDLFTQLMFLVKDNTTKLISLQYKLNQKHLFQSTLVKLSHVINLQEFIDLNLQDITQTVDTSLSLFTRIFDNLQVKSVVTHLTNIALTNLIDEDTKDFWLNSMGERNYLRLNKSMNNMYDQVRNILFKYIVPSCERLIIILTDLIGIVVWLNDQDEQPFGLSELDIYELIELIKDQIKLCYKVIFDIQQEQTLFNQFITWIKSLIDKMSDQQASTELNMGNIIKYINTGLSNSVLTSTPSFNQLNEKFTLLIDSVNTFHKSILYFTEITQINLPDSYSNLELQQINNQWILSN